MDISIKCAHAGVTTGEWSNVIRDVYGEYRAPTGIVSSHIQKQKIKDWSENTESLMFTNETRSVIKSAVDLLPEKEKVVFLLRDVEGLSTEKTGEILDLTVPAVKSRLHRARLFLRKKLSTYFDEFASGKARK